MGAGAKADPTKLRIGTLGKNCRFQFPFHAAFPLLNIEDFISYLDCTSHNIFPLIAHINRYSISLFHFFPNEGYTHS